MNCALQHNLSNNWQAIEFAVVFWYHLPMNTPTKPGIYTGVGSQKTPLHVLGAMADLGEQLARQGWTLRSGGARGADSAFEAGHRRVTADRLEIYLPWKGFNQNPSSLFGVTEAALQLAARNHPAWHACTENVRKLHGRNAYQVLGQDLDTPSQFVVCWTPDGAASRKERSRDTGGTGTAISVADGAGVPVFNLARRGERDRLMDWLAGLPAKGGQSSLF